MKHFVNESSDMGFSLEVFPMGGVHKDYQRPTKKEKRAAAGKATVRRANGKQAEKARVRRPGRAMDARGGEIREFESVPVVAARMSRFFGDPPAGHPRHLPDHRGALGKLVAARPGGRGRDLGRQSPLAEGAPHRLRREGSV